MGDLGFGELFWRVGEGCSFFYQLSHVWQGRPEGGGGLLSQAKRGEWLLWSQSSCTVLPQWLQVKWQIHESLHKLEIGRHPVNAKPFQFN